MWRFFCTDEDIYYRIEQEDDDSGDRDDRKALFGQRWYDKEGRWKDDPSPYTPALLEQMVRKHDGEHYHEVLELPYHAQVMHLASLRKYTVLFIEMDCWRMEHVTVRDPADAEDYAEKQLEKRLAGGPDISLPHSILVFEGHIEPVMTG